MLENLDKKINKQHPESPIHILIDESPMFISQDSLYDNDFVSEKIRNLDKWL